MPGQPEPGSEAWLAYIWQARLLPEPIFTTAGGRIAVITPGLPNRDRGPDFRGAMLLFDDGVLREGDVEVHRFAGDWEAHGHATDPQYNGVVLHLVGAPKPGPGPHRPDGTLIPEVVVPPHLLAGASYAAGVDYRPAQERPCQGLQTEVAAATLTPALEELGRLRFLERTRRFQAELEALSPNQVLYRALLEGLGYGRNQEAYQILADRLPWERLRAQALRAEHPALAISEALFAAAGLAPGAVAPLAWDRFRLLPAARPEARLRAAGRLLARMLPEGPVRGCGALVLQGGGRPGSLLRLLTVSAERGDGGLGRDRAVALAVNAVLPFLWAWAESQGSGALAAQTLALYAQLPASGGDRVTRWLDVLWGGPGPHTAVGEQGQHYLYRGWCAPAACGRCPLLARVGRHGSGEAQAWFDIQAPGSEIAGLQPEVARGRDHGAVVRA